MNALAERLRRLQPAAMERCPDSAGSPATEPILLTGAVNGIVASGILMAVKPG